MLAVYVSHPYGGKEENKEAAAALTQKLQLDYEDADVAFYSPIHAIQTGSYNSVDYEKGLAMALELMLRCDVLLLAPSWRESLGCHVEFLAARKLQMPVVTGRKGLEDVIRMGPNFKVITPERHRISGLASVKSLIKEVQETWDGPA